MLEDADGELLPNEIYQREKETFGATGDIARKVNFSTRQASFS